jgi:RimJ/RimL family protein N-acetyltransferase
MRIETERLIISKFDLSMVKEVHLNSLDEETRAFLPDEVFETEEIAKETLEYLISVYENGDGPLVYPILLKDETYVGYVQAVPIDDGKYEIGFHVGKQYRKNGYASEAVKAFLPIIMKKLDLDVFYGICLSENKASVKVMESCGFIKEFEGSGIYQDAEREIVKFIFKS